MSFDEIRQELDEITAPGTDSSTWVQKIEELRRVHPHTIRHVERTTGRRFNCFAFAFRLENSVAHHQISTLSPSIFADMCFVKFLERRELIAEKELSDREAGDILVYENRQVPLHAGRVSSGQRVTSKWGDGPMFDHEVDQVPASYGSTYRCFSPLESAIVEKYFLEYARCMGHGSV